MRPSRRQILAAAATLILLSFGAAVGVPVVAKRAMRHAAQARGWSIRSEGGKIGWRGVWFDRVELEVKQRVTAHVELGATCVGWSSLFGRRKVTVGFGHVEVIGELRDLRALWSGESGGDRPRPAPNATGEYSLHHVDVVWREHEGAPPNAIVSGLELEQSRGRVTLHVGSLSAFRGATSIELRNAIASPNESDKPNEASAEEIPAALPKTRISVAEMWIKYDTSSAPGVDAAVREPSDGDESVSPAADTHGKQAVTKSGHTSAPLRGAQAKTHVAANPNKKQLLPALAWLFDELDRLRAETAGSAAPTGAPPSRWLEKIAIGTSFECPSLHVRIVDTGQKLDLGPWPLKAERRPDEFAVEVSQDASAGKSALSAQLTLAERLERGKVNFSVGPIALSQLGATDGDFGLENVAATQLELEARAQFETGTGEISIESKGWVERLSIRQPYLARDTVKNISFAWEGAVALDAARRQLKSDSIRLSVGPVSARLHGAVELSAAYQTIQAALEVPLAACQDLVNVLPDGLAPLLRGWRLDQNFALRLTVAFDSRRPEKAVIGFNLDNHCRVVTVPLEVSPHRFEQPFTLEVEDEHGAFQSTSFGPGTWGWTPLGAISPYVESAVLVCEDGRFLYHDGFDREAIQNSIRENLRTQRFARGASTVSMQLAKNLYLRRDKTIARKLQEAALTMLLEQSFSKRQLLELYLNVIEFGPGIYGIGPASKHYFDTTPDRLSLAQAFFLVSILPNPKVSHFGPDGLVRPGWMKLVRSLMTIAQRRGHISSAELEAAVAEQPAFGVPGSPTTVPTHRLLQDPGTGFDDELVLPSLDDD